MSAGLRDRHGRGIRRPVATPLLAAGSGRGQHAVEIVASLMNRLRSNHPHLLAGVSWEVLDIPEPRFMKQPVPEFRVDREERKIYLYRIPILKATGGLIEPRWAIESRVYVALGRLVERSPGFLKSRPKPNEPKR